MRLAWVEGFDLHQGEHAVFRDGRPMSEAEFLAVGETPERVELLDGSLRVTPVPVPRHQVVSRRVASALGPGADAAGLHVLAGVNVRLGPDRIVVPDIVIAADIDVDDVIVDAADVRLVCEVLSPCTSATDKVLKMHYYAEAGIPWYLLVDPRTGGLRLQELLDATYDERSVTRVGEILRLTEPVVASIDPAELLRAR